MLEPSWTGRRVTVRRVTESEQSGPSRTPRTVDVVGDLLRLDATTAVIDTRGGPVEVPLASVVAAKIAPPSTADELALEGITALGLRPAEVRPLDGWLLRADHGFTSRANSVLPLGRLSVALDEALATAQAWYAERGLPLRMQVPLEARRLLDAELGERGWDFSPPVSVLARRLEPAPPAPRVPVELADAPDDGWLALYRGGAGLQADARALLTRHDHVVFASVRRDGKVVATGRGAVDGGWLGVMAVEVDPAQRRQGLATAVMHALEGWGRAQSVGRAYLQVSSGNAAGAALYAALGYWLHHDYHYRSAPEPPDAPASHQAPGASPSAGPWA